MQEEWQQEHSSATAKAIPSGAAQVTNANAKTNAKTNAKGRDQQTAAEKQMLASGGRCAAASYGKLRCQHAQEILPK